MKLVVRGLLAIGVLICMTSMTSVSMNSAALAQGLFAQRFNAASIYSVREVEPEVVEIVLVLQDQTRMALRMNIFVARGLGMQLSRFGS